MTMPTAADLVRVINDMLSNPLVIIALAYLVLYPLIRDRVVGWLEGADTEPEKPKNDEKPKRVARLGDDGEMLFDDEPFNHVPYDKPEPIKSDRISEMSLPKPCALDVPGESVGYTTMWR